MRRDDEGWDEFVDRSKDAIRRRGENVSSFEVEQVLLSYRAVVECAVYPVSSDLGEDEVMAAVVLEPGVDPDAVAIMTHCERHLPYFAVPRYLRFPSALPKTSTEKIMKAVLRTEGISPDTWDREREGYALAR